MPPNSTTLTWDNFGTATSEDLKSAIVSTVWNATPFLNWLYKNRKNENFGTYIEQPIEYNSSISTVDTKPIRGYSDIDFNDEEFLTNIRFSPAFYQDGVAMSKVEFTLNARGGNTQIIKLLQAKARRLSTIMKQKIATDAFSGTGTGTSGNPALIGTNTVLENTAFGSQTSTYANMARSSLTSLWQNQRDTVALSSLTWNDLNSMINDCSDGSDDVPDMIVTTQAIFEKLWALVDARHAFLSNKGDLVPFNQAKADMGWRAIDFNGTPIIWDRKQASGRIEFLNSEYFYLSAHPDMDMVTSDWLPMEVAGKNAKGMHAEFLGQICCTALNRQGLITCT